MAAFLRNSSPFDELPSSLSEASSPFVLPSTPSLFSCTRRILLFFAYQRFPSFFTDPSEPLGDPS